jgi:hypothetical protein
MQPQKQEELKCVDGRCPAGIEQVKKIGLTPREKRAIFFSLKEKIFNLKLKKIRILDDPEIYP